MALLYRSLWERCLAFLLESEDCDSTSLALSRDIHLQVRGEALYALRGWAFKRTFRIKKAAFVFVVTQKSCKNWLGLPKRLHSPMRLQTQEQYQQKDNNMLYKTMFCEVKHVLHLYYWFVILNLLCLLGNRILWP